MQNVTFHKNDEVTVRKIDVALPPPPPPPPPLQLEAKASDNDSPSIDLLGIGQGPSLRYSDTPSMSVPSLEKVEKPDFDVDSLDLRKTLSVDFPVIDVKNLDKIPRLLSKSAIKFPRSLVERGIRQVTTKVELIIDQNGKPYIKKIVDPVYPEMIDTIRETIKNARFTVPTKNGLPVQADYLYKLTFVYRV